MTDGAARACAFVACAAGVLATFVGAPAGAQTNRSLTQVERDRRTETARVEQLRAEADVARRDVGALDTRLVESGQRRAEAEAAATAAEQRLAALQLQIDAETLRRRNARDTLESALITAAFTERRLEPRAVRANIFARAIAPTLALEESRSAQAIARSHALASTVADERVILAGAQTAMEAERAQLTGLLARRRATQTQLVSDLAAAERRARTLSAEARTLRELAQRVQPARRGGASPSGPSAIPATWLAPTEGRIARSFGAREGEAPAAQGALLRTRASAQIISPAAGEITYAGPFRSYGQVLILNLDGGYAVVLTGLATISARVGERVRAGQPVGEMPASDTPAPELYVEVRREGRPVDPGRWLSAPGLAAGRTVRAG
jgi:septal ring factor EnvC (AmiA/AmiB activator)